MSILITGSEGYIGKYLKKYLKKKGLNVCGLDKKRNIEITCNILDKEKLFSVFKKIKPVVVVHLAARTDLKGNTLEEYNENILGTNNLIEICNKTKSVSRVVFASTMLVHNINRKNFYKNKFFNPLTKYGESKAIMEKNINNSKKNFSWCLIRPTTIWGGKMKNHMNLFLRLIKIGLYFNIDNKKPIFKSYGYIINSCYQIYKIINAKKKLINSKTFYICDYDPIEFNDWTDKIALRLKNRKNLKINYKIYYFFAKIGDIFVSIGFKNFPIQTFRLNNMITAYHVKNKNLQKIASKLPYKLNEAIKEFVDSNN